MSITADIRDFALDIGYSNVGIAKGQESSTDQRKLRIEELNDLKTGGYSQ